MNEFFVVGIDLGGTKISGAISDIDGNIIERLIVSTNASKGESYVMNRIIDVIDSLIKTSGKSIKSIKSIGIGSPGPLDSENGIIITTPNLPFKNFNLVKPIKDKFKVPVYLDNDGNVAAMGEFLYGEGKNTKNMIYITVSTGIGGGAVLNGKMYRGGTGNALEIGHNTIVPDGPLCNCGNYGCLEALASGTAITRQAVDAIKNGATSSLSKYKEITTIEVFKEAEIGDILSKEIIEVSLNYLGIGIANLVATFDPEVIILGGGVIKTGEIVIDSIKKVVDKRCFKNMASSCRIVKAKLGSDAGVMGALALALLDGFK
jgi:glucokinase